MTRISLLISRPKSISFFIKSEKIFPIPLELVVCLYQGKRKQGNYNLRRNNCFSNYDKSVLNWLWLPYTKELSNMTDEISLFFQRQFLRAARPSSYAKSTTFKTITFFFFHSVLSCNSMVGKTNVNSF